MTTLVTQGQADANSASVSINLNPVGGNLLALIMGSGNTQAISSMTIGGVPVTPIASDSRRAFGYLRISPGSQTWTVTPAASSFCTIVGFVFKDARKAVEVVGTNAAMTVAIPAGMGPADVPVAMCGHTDATTTSVSHTSITIGIRGGAQRAAYTASGTFSFSGGTGTAMSMACIIRHGVPGGQIIMVMAERWKSFLRDLRAGLVPADVLRERYRDLVTI